MHKNKRSAERALGRARAASGQAGRKRGPCDSDGHGSRPVEQTSTATGCTNGDLRELPGISILPTTWKERGNWAAVARLGGPRESVAWRRGLTNSIVWVESARLIGEFLVRVGSLWPEMGGFTVESGSASRDTRWALGWLSGVVLGSSALLVVLVGPLHIATGGTGHVAAVLAFVGVLVTAAASIIGLTVSRRIEPCRRKSSKARCSNAGGRIILFSNLRAGELRFGSFELARAY